MGSYVRRRKGRSHSSKAGTAFTLAFRRCGHARCRSAAGNGSRPAPEHRDKADSASPFLGWAAVARPVKPSEVKSNAKAQAAVQKERDAKRALKVWREDKVLEWSDVRAEAKKAGRRVHVGYVFSTCS